jgi:hypothetical protein
MTDLSPEKYFGIWRIKADSCGSLEAARYHFLPSLDLVITSSLSSSPSLRPEVVDPFIQPVSHGGSRSSSIVLDPAAYITSP